MPGKIGQVTSARNVPDWTRNKKKYTNEVEAIMGLEIGQAVPIEFDSEEEALAARNTIRDELNFAFRRALIKGEPLPMKGMVSTRVERGTSMAWFSMDDPATVLGAGWDKGAVQQQSASKGRASQRKK